MTYFLGPNMGACDGSMRCPDIKIGETDAVMMQHYNKDETLHRIDIKLRQRIGEHNYKFLHVASVNCHDHDNKEDVTWRFAGIILNAVREALNETVTTS